MGLHATVMGKDLKFSGLLADDALLLDIKAVDGVVRVSVLEVETILQIGYERFRDGFGHREDLCFGHFATYAAKLELLSNWWWASKEQEIIFA